MPARFTRLRIAGFKSFAEPVELEILPGLTGVVGPNGCGKSNVAEALRWVMGETNARSLRGGEMDDVIFAGTAARPSRNLAEVSITLSSEGNAAFPSPFDTAPELQVARRIERGGGSMYRLNGKEARARDVQTLFADLASGARSSAMVSQGRIGTIVSARPDERRSVLEEAAGIGGLHARRAEAEGKLRAAEANLERAEDQRAALATQLGGLERQARQATRYRGLTTGIQEAEAALIHLRHARAAAARHAARTVHEAAADAVMRAAAAAVGAQTRAREAAAALPPLRTVAATARDAALQARIAKESAGAEATRLQDAMDQAAARQSQAARDHAHAERIQADADAADARLLAEQQSLAAQIAADDSGTALRAAETGLAETQAALPGLEAAAAEAAAASAQSTATLQAAATLLNQAEARHRRAQDALFRLEQQRARAAATAIAPERMEAAVDAERMAEAAIADATQALDQADQAKADAQPRAASARAALARATQAHATVRAEATALAEILAVREGDRWPPMVDALTVQPGYEAALGAAFGDDLAAAGDHAAARHWRALPELETYLDVGTPLSCIVHGPAALTRALSAIAVVDAADGDSLQAGLRAGQCLVTQQGALWRWDGYTVRAGAPSAAAVRLQQRNRLATLRRQVTEAEAVHVAARQSAAEADQAERVAHAAEATARPARRRAEQALDGVRDALRTLRAQAAAAAQQSAALNEQHAECAPEAKEAATALAAAQAACSALPDPAQLRHRADQARTALHAARQRDSAASRALDTLQREHAARRARVPVVAREREDWRLRALDALSRATDLSARLHEAAAASVALADAPARAAVRVEAATAALRQADQAQRAADEVLASAETKAEAAGQATQAANQALSKSRETLARTESDAAHAEQAWREAGAITPIGPVPDDLSAGAEDRARQRLDRMLRERDAIGPVNLLAEDEAATISQSIAAIVRDQEEVTSAIAKLRGAIGHLNREGRERLSAVFQQVDKHFQALFGRMFGGGRAHLALVGSDDPLLAGLEIYAQPPGKKLSSLALLSGGEQALTALSLIFAVFRCNPAPVCVLDEVDAPLDDPNVNRFCALLADMVAETGTRFLVVTHHQLTMARMDRLYGVTMQERGVSRLLSVDLGRAVAMAEAVAAE